MPSFRTALKYEVLFGVPVARIFPGLLGNLQKEAETQLTKLERKLQNTSSMGPQAVLTAKKLEWITDRRSNHLH